MITETLTFSAADLAAHQPALATTLLSVFRKHPQNTQSLLHALESRIARVAATSSERFPVSTKRMDHIHDCLAAFAEAKLLPSAQTLAQPITVELTHERSTLSDTATSPFSHALTFNPDEPTEGLRVDRRGVLGSVWARLAMGPSEVPLSTALAQGHSIVVPDEALPPIQAALFAGSVDVIGFLVENGLDEGAEPEALGVHPDGAAALAAARALRMLTTSAPSNVAALPS